MPVSTLSIAALAAWVRGVASGPDGEGAVVVAELDGTGPTPPLHPGIGAVVVGITRHEASHAHPAAELCDIVLAAEDPLLDAIVSTVEANPAASLALAGLLRGSGARSAEDGLLAESAVYSALQAGPEFARWRALHRRRPRAADREPPVLIDRTGEVLRITLNRPHVRNAVDASMRDLLVEAFRLPGVDPSIAEVRMGGAGPAFCAGGDLDEFGSRPDPASAHLLRTRQSVGRAIAAVADRVTVRLHGACVGSGIELPAFAARVVADPSTRIALPEVSLGLIPGAGGTVSLPRRIGRHRTAALALSGLTIDAATALAWGLIDDIAG